MAPPLLLPLFPSEALAGYSAHKRPTFASLVQSPVSGREVTNSEQIYPLWEFELPFEILRDQSQNQTPFAATLGYTDLQTLSGFWVQAGAQFGSFIYQDLTDYSRTDQIIGTGDGATSSFPLVRTFGTPPLALVEPIGAIDVRIGKTVNVYLNGIPLSQTGNWWIGDELRTIRFTTPPGGGVVITMDFDFFYLCRFIEDSLELEEFMTGRWTIKRLRFRSTRRGPTSATIIDIDSTKTKPPTPSIDFPVGTFNNNTFIDVEVNTVKANDTLVVVVYSHDASVTEVSADFGVPLGFTQVDQVNNNLYLFKGKASGVLTGATITAQLSASAQASIAVIPINGVFDSSQPFFDPNPLLPATAGPDDATGQHVQISTTNPENILLYACGTKGPFSSIDNPSGWASLVYTSFETNLRVSFLSVSSPQTALNVNPATSDAHETVSLAVAINGAV